MSHSQAHTIAAVQCDSYDPEKVYSSLFRQFELLGGIERFVRLSSRVLIKPNLIAPRGPDIPAQTHPEVIYAVARIVKEAGAVPLIGDSSAWSNAANCLKALGIDQRLRSLGAEIVQLNQPVRIKLDGVTVGISRVALEADVIINLPKLKAHQQITATFAIKNMYGCVAGLAGKEKVWWHFARGKERAVFSRILVQIYQKLNPAINIIDAVVGMEGQGPLSGQSKKIGYLVAGVNPVACERVCCDLVGFDPLDLPLLTAACNTGLGSLDDSINRLGDPFEIPACKDFKPAVQTPLRFSFPHICKSLAKQGIILIKGQ